MSKLFSKTEKKPKKELTPAQQKAKTAAGWIVSILCVIIILGALAISVLTITRTTGESGVANIFGYTFNSIVTDSMEPTIETGELIIGKLYDDDEDRADLQVGQVIVYKKSVYNAAAGGNVMIYKCHRIVSIASNSVKVVGDNKNPEDGSAPPEGGETVSYENIVATWGTPATLKEDGTFDVTKDTEGGSLGKLGKFVNWLQSDRTNYFCVIVLPLILLFVIYGFVLIRSLVIARINKANENKEVNVGELSDDEKKRLAEELLASLNNKADDSDEFVAVEDNAEDNVTENTEETAEDSIVDDNAPADDNSVADDNGEVDGQD